MNTRRILLEVWRYLPNLFSVLANSIAPCRRLIGDLFILEVWLRSFVANSEVLVWLLVSAIVVMVSLDGAKLNHTMPAMNISISLGVLIAV
jgi:hypothetical protein